VRHSWRGNVRELRNMIERACVLGQLDRAFDAEASGDRTLRTDLPFKEAKHQIVEAFEREYIEALVGRHGSLAAAAREAQIDRKHFRELMKKYNLSAT
jgi:DNA-binding NtrC family response regulator